MLAGGWEDKEDADTFHDGGARRRVLEARRETMGDHQTCKTDRIFTFKLNYFLRFLYD